jgi:CheY-like chemotaxis protein|nr:MAG: hypothetical protein KatS3mg041_1479 [Bacteroidota bacterium]
MALFAQSPVAVPANRGDCFFLYRAAADEGALSASSSSPSHLTSEDRGPLPVVLVVEDNPDVRRLFRLYLKGSYRLLEATTGEEAFRIVQQERVDLILMDINLPGEWDGLQTARLIRSLPGMAHVPIIAQTAYASVFDARQALEAGCAYYMTKPIYRHELLSVLKRFLP